MAILPFSAMCFMVLEGFVYTITADIYAFILHSATFCTAFSIKTHCVLHHFTLHFAPKRTAFSGILQ